MLFGTRSPLLLCSLFQDDLDTMDQQVFATPDNVGNCCEYLVTSLAGRFITNAWGVSHTDLKPSV